MICISSSSYSYVVHSWIMFYSSMIDSWHTSRWRATRVYCSFLYAVSLNFSYDRTYLRNCVQGIHDEGRPDREVHLFASILLFPLVIFIIAEEIFVILVVVVGAALVRFL